VHRKSWMYQIKYGLLRSMLPVVWQSRSHNLSHCTSPELPPLPALTGRDFARLPRSSSSEEFCADCMLNDILKLLKLADIFSLQCSLPCNLKTSNKRLHFKLFHLGLPRIEDWQWRNYQKQICVKRLALVSRSGPLGSFGLPRRRQSKAHQPTIIQCYTNTKSPLICSSSPPRPLPLQPFSCCS
jgi:hypothetical protein